MAGEGLPDEAYLAEDALTIAFDESVPLGASPGAVGWEPTVAYARSPTGAAARARL